MIETGIKLLLIFQIFVGGKEIKFRLPATVRMSFSLPNDSTKYEHRVEFENISKEFISEEVVRQAIEKNIIYLLIIVI